MSLTITEKATATSPATGKLMLDHPLIAADLQNPHQPVCAGCSGWRWRDAKRRGCLP